MRVDISPGIAESRPAEAPPIQAWKPKVMMGVSIVLSGWVGLLVAIVIARFSGLFQGYAQSGNFGPMFLTDVGGAFQKGVPFGLLMVWLAWIPKPAFKWVVFLSLTVGGLIYGQYAFGGYVRDGDRSGLVLTPYGLLCAACLPMVHRYFWKLAQWAYATELKTS